MTITNEFEVQIVILRGDNVGQTVAPNLAAAITSFERELDDPNEEEDDTADEGFLLAESTGEEQDDEEEEDEGDPQDQEDDEEGEEELPDSVLTVQANVTREVMADLVELRDMEDARLRISFSYGGGILKRTFDIGSEFWIAMNSGSKEPTPLSININFDAYHASTDF